MTKTVEVDTVHGTMTYETVECSSCETEVSKQEAKQFVMGTLREKDTYRALGKVKYGISTQDVCEGWVCPYCYDSGPISFPNSSQIDRITAKRLITFMFGVLAGVVGLSTLIVAVG